MRNRVISGRLDGATYEPRVDDIGVVRGICQLVRVHRLLVAETSQSRQDMT